MAHVLNDETSRKYIQSIKRLLTFAQTIRPPSDLSQKYVLAPSMCGVAEPSRAMAERGERVLTPRFLLLGWAEAAPRDSTPVMHSYPCNHQVLSPSGSWTQLICFAPADKLRDHS